jgi:putative DNA primase/helicase
MSELERQGRDAFLAQYRDTVYTLDHFWRFRDGAWQPLTLETARAELVVIFERLHAHPSSRMLASLLDHLRLALARPAAGWNQQLSLLPCRNGVLDTATTSLVPQLAAHFQARSLPVAYDPSAPAPAWQSFLSSTIPAAADFLQEFAGLALTFDSRYETAVWLYGPPGSGKSTFLAGLQAMLGNRAGQLDLLTLGRRRLPPAQLFGRSLLLSAEQPVRDLEQDHLLNALISGEPLIVEHPSAEPDLLILNAKWIWAMVSLPRLNRSTSGLYRRVRIVPFPPRAEADRDPALKERLTAEGSGILNWALAGLARLNRRGRFAPPAIVTQAGQRFGLANDVAAQFVAEECSIDPQVRESAAKLYQSYAAWCRRSGLRPESTNTLAAEWERLGFQRRRLRGGSYWFGLRLRSSRSPHPSTSVSGPTGDPPAEKPEPESVATAATAATPATAATAATPATAATTAAAATAATAAAPAATAAPAAPAAPAA